MGHAVSLGATLFVTWLLLSGIYEPLFFGLGAFSCTVIVCIALRMDVIDSEALPLHLTRKITFYWAWLFKEIVKSNIDVAKLILHPKMPITPTVFRVKATQRDELGKVIYANSITLTPGTVTMDIDEDEFEVHALAATTAADLSGGDMDRRVTSLYSVKDETRDAA